MMWSRMGRPAGPEQIGVTDVNPLGLWRSAALRELYGVMATMTKR